MTSVTVRICVGTTCFVMSSSELELLPEQLPPELADRVKIEVSHCLGYCKDRNYGRAPFVEIDGEPIDRVTLPKLIEEIQKRLADK